MGKARIVRISAEEDFEMRGGGWVSVPKCTGHDACAASKVDKDSQPRMGRGYRCMHWKSVGSD